MLTQKGYDVKKQNVSFGILHDGLKVDIIPARKHEGHTNYHSIYVSKTNSWKITNIQLHIQLVKDSGRIDEIKLAKIWSKLHNLDFPSFYLELSVIEALKGRSKDQLDLNFQHVLADLSTELISRRVVDPANSNNIISESLTDDEKRVISRNAEDGYRAPGWNGVIW